MRSPIGGRPNAGPYGRGTFSPAPLRRGAAVSDLSWHDGPAEVTVDVPTIGKANHPMHQGSCHCGAVKLKIPSTPSVATDCNCSLCRRIGGPWVYFRYGTVEIEGHPGNTADYIQGDRTLRTIRCRTCGCVTHWEPLEPKAGSKHGVNLGNFDPALIAAVPVRRFDGADTWRFFDELPSVGIAAPDGNA